MDDVIEYLNKYNDMFLIFHILKNFQNQQHFHLQLINSF